MNIGNMNKVEEVGGRVSRSDMIGLDACPIGRRQIVAIIPRVEGSLKGGNKDCHQNKGADKKAELDRHFQQNVKLVLR